jgi:hypothetical protein
MNKHINDHHIVDKIIKSIWINSDKISNHVKTLYTADYCRVIESNICCLEYENSSRGFVSHICKYIHLGMMNPEKSFYVTIIGSVHHKKTHHTDYIKANATYNCCSLTNVIVNFMYDDGTGSVVYEQMNELLAKE